MSSPSTLRHTKLLLISMISFSLVGCQSLSESARKLDDSMPWNAEQAARRHHENSAARIVAIWSHDVLSTPNNGAVQGFGGRMYFYNRRQEAVKVEGQLSSMPSMIREQLRPTIINETRVENTFFVRTSWNPILANRNWDPLIASGYLGKNSAATNGKSALFPCSSPRMGRL